MTGPTPPDHPGDPGPPPGMRGDPGPPPSAGGHDPGPPPGHDPGPPPLNLEMIRYFWIYLREDRRKLWITLTLLIIMGAFPAILGLVPMLLTSHWQPDKVHLLWWGLAGLFVLGLVMHGLQYLETLLTAEVSQNFGRRLRAAIFRKIGRLPSQAVTAQSVGALAYRSTSDVFRIQSLIMPTVPMMLSEAAALFFMVVALFILGPGFALVGLLVMPLTWIVVAKLNKRVTVFAQEGQRQSEAIMTSFIEGVGGYRDLVAAGRFGEAAREFDTRLMEFQRTQIATSTVNYWSSLVPLLAFSILTFAYYFYQTTNSAAVGDMAFIGKVISFAGLVSMTQGPAISVTKFFTEAALAAPSFMEVRRLLDSPEVADPGQGQRPQDGGIELRDVTFQYSPEAPPILDRVSFRIQPGSFTAIVGQTGSGKSTLFHLLLRLIEPTDGEIRLGNVPLRDVSLTDLRDFVGFIPQAPFIFDSTLRENLCMGLPAEQIGEARILQAVQQARLEKLINSRASQGGLNARAGPGGATLSGGERQRVALGRIFLRDPQVIICDEYTANIDNATARLIHETLERVFAGKTRVVITHQLYTIRGADNILVLDRGRIVESGSHEELLQKPGLYRDMWEVQRLA
jgi:ABC-type multidrug transport system fused ATPase/permease subunit